MMRLAIRTLRFRKGGFVATFIAVASAPVFALEPARRWFAGLVDDFVDDFVGGSAEARVVNPECPPGDAFCERDDESSIPCPFPTAALAPAIRRS